LRFLPWDAQWRSRFTRLLGRILRGSRGLRLSAGSPQRQTMDAKKTASRTERAPNLPREEKDHAPGLMDTIKNKGIAY
jgi:hypothetical protein